MVQSAIITLMDSVKRTAKPTTSMNLVRKLRGRNPRKGRDRRPLSGRSGSTV